MAQKRADLIWIARPRPGADETAARLDALGLRPDFETLVSPMIALESVSHPRPVADFRARHPDGRMGSDPLLATPEKGGELVALAAKGLVSELAAFSAEKRLI